MPVHELQNLPAGSLATIAGGAVGAIIAPGPWWERVAAGVVGGCFAWFVAPIAAPFVYAGLEALDKAFLGDVVVLDMAHVTSFTGFLAGSTGMLVPTSLHRILSSIRDRAVKKVGKA